VSAPARPRSPLALAAIAGAAIIALWFALMFALANDDWAVVRLPTMPWSASRSVAVLEARLFAVMLASLFFGAVFASLVWWRVIARLRRRFAAEGARSERMESELAALDRLVSTSREQNGRKS